VLEKDGKKFEFEFLITTQNPYAEKMATMMKEQCKKVGIVVTIRALEWGAFLEQLNEDKYDCCTLGWSWDWPENDPYQVWHSSQIANRGSNRVHFKNEEADRLILAIREEFDDAKRLEMCRKLHAIIYEEQPYTFLINPRRIGLYHKRFQNMRFDKYPQGPDPRAGIEFWVKKGEEKYK
jgi:ABC-type transport system substrate-binding protein